MEAEIKEATPSKDSLGTESTTNKVLTSYSRTNVINYAYEWWNNRNPSYPDFGSNCSNFISQAMKAGGFSFEGSGDNCKHENTETEWYVYENPSPPFWCTGSFRDWEWSTSWSVVYPFKRYFTYRNNYATELGWTISHFTAAYYLSPGDIVQLQQKSGSNWVSYHNMLVTKETSSVGLYLTYNSKDTKDKPLRDIPAGSTQRYILIRFP